ncbi:MAG TPA: hypothetical protein VM510_05900 [Caulifigura sp.]|jgi:hypothetical protein|nr:hypothetical protein [Caulifigura sp.]
MDSVAHVISGSLWDLHQRRLSGPISIALSPPEPLGDRWRGYMTTNSSITSQLQPGDSLVIQQRGGREIPVTVTKLSSTKIQFQCATPESPCRHANSTVAPSTEERPQC